ncbi:hypothetical protein [Actinoplanes philippinensis]|uniref:hypothetical protein n=1 Tax=Actinoplanes philippinensis TaxID=35752 RepID=UPI0033FA1F6F
MSTDILLAMHANRTGRAVPRAAYRHVHLTPKPFVVVAYHLPGDPSTPIGLLYGTRRTRPEIAVAQTPFTWANKIKTITNFARDLNRYVGEFVTGDTRRAPQLIVPNKATAEWLCADMGRFLRNLPEEGEWAGLTPGSWTRGLCGFGDVRRSLLDLLVGDR